MTEKPASGKRTVLVALPLIFFVVLAGVLYLRLFAGDITLVPSPLVGRAAPQTDLPPLDMGNGEKGLKSAEFKGKVTVVNVWASWCVPCRDEHPQLMTLARQPDIRLVGINYKDAPENARDFLQAMGNPFAAIGVDTAGRTAIDWGVYGVPETFIVNAEGVITYKHIGAITEEGLEKQLLPALEKARQTAVQQ